MSWQVEFLYEPLDGEEEIELLLDIEVTEDALIAHNQAGYLQDYPTFEFKLLAVDGDTSSLTKADMDRLAEIVRTQGDLLLPEEAFRPHEREYEREDDDEH